MANLIFGAELRMQGGKEITNDKEDQNFLIGVSIKVIAGEGQKEDC